MATQQDRQKISSRYATLSPNLRALLFSAQTAEIVRVACESNHLPLEKNPGVAKIVGLVFFGFIHPEDLAGELEGGASIPAQTAINIADSLNKKLFAPIKSDLEKIYAPLPHEHEIAIGPKILQEIRPTPRVVSQTAVDAAAAPKPGAIPLPPVSNIKIAPPPMAPAPKPPLPDVGWSKSTAESPVVKLSEASPRIPQPAAEKPAPIAPRPMPSEIKGSIGEFERIAMRQGETAAPKPPAAPVPAPMIIHEDAVFKPKEQPRDFRLQLPVEKFNLQGPAAPPSRAAVLELGKTVAPGAAMPKPPAPSTPRVVHYTEYGASTPAPPAAPSAPQGQRRITEVTAAPPPPPPPKPPVLGSH